MKTLKNTAVTIKMPPKQCGMNFVAGLMYAPTIEQQIEVLDFAFTCWGSDSPWGAFGKEDNKSQVIFTDTVDKEAARWAEIKKICYRGPVTKNRRYDNNPFHQKEIAVYILTWEDYSKWRAEYMESLIRENPAIYMGPMMAPQINV